MRDVETGSEAISFTFAFQALVRRGGTPSPTNKLSALPVTAFRLADGRFWEIVRPRLLSASFLRSDEFKTAGRNANGV